jgi:hypothetical protein
MADIPGAVVASIESHGQFLTTLALTTSGAVFAFLIQIMFHNSQDGRTQIKIARPGFLLAAIILNFVSIACWYALKSTLVASIPAIYALKWDGKSTTAVLADNGFNLISLFSALQISFFSAALIALLVALFFNLHLIRGKRRS